MNDKNKTKKERASNLIIANKENAYKLASANKSVSYKNDKKGKQLDALINSNVENAMALSIAANKELNVQNIENEKQIADLIQAKEKAEESDRLKSAFLANVSHEIRTPMNGILGFADLLKQPELTGEELHHFIGIIEKSGERMLNIINDLINISKIESGQMDINTT